MQKDLREIIRTIIEYVFRRKGLNYILYIMAAFWIREATNLSASEGIETLLQAIKGNAEFPHWRYLIASIGGILFTEGSWLIFTLTSAMIFFFGFLKYKEISKSDSISPTEFLDQIRDIQKDDKKFLTARPPKTTGFIGREEELKELDDRLIAKDQVLLVNGLGGIGKTEVCRTYFWANTKRFEKLGWIDYLGNLKESFTNQFQIKEISVTENESLDERFAKILHYLANLDPNSLLIIDNIEDLEDPDLPKLRSLPCKVIASSRLTLKGFEVYPLGFLSTEKCKTLFMQNYQGKPDDAALEKIIELTGQHTLSVELLAKTARNGDLEIAELLNRLQEAGFNLTETIPESVETTWHDETQKKRFFEHMESVFELANITRDEQSILANLSVLPAVFIERKQLTDWLKLQTKDHLNSLVEKGWLQQQGSQVFMHQIIQDVARHKLKPTATTCEQLIDNLTWKLKVEPGDNPLAKAGYVVFAESVLARLTQSDENLASLANNLAQIYQDLGQLEKALEFQMKSLKIMEEILDPKHPSLATSYNNLATIYKALGQLEKALEFQMKSLKIREEILDPNHPDLATSYNNLAT
ncbi:ATP-binding protein, partial [candidate division KSB1 bacterium]|nr:ATP-binding protein [candidate division KSB1 bacterium]